jgi:hypothetical protein
LKDEIRSPKSSSMQANVPLRVKMNFKLIERFWVGAKRE